MHLPLATSITTAIRISVPVTCATVYGTRDYCSRVKTAAAFDAAAALCRPPQSILCRSACALSLVFAVPACVHASFLGLADGDFQHYVQACDGTDTFARPDCDSTGGQTNLLDHSEL